MSVLKFMTFGGVGGEAPPVGGVLSPVASVSGVVWDENVAPNRYAGFPYGDKAKDNSLVAVYKVSNTHGSTGPLTFSRSTNGGQTWQHQQITVGGVGLECSALVMKVLSTGRILVVYQDNPGDVANTYQDMKTVYSDDTGQTWQMGGAWNWNTDNSFKYISSIYGRPLQLPSGKILIAYYQLPNTGYTTTLPGIAAILESVDGGATWTQGATILSHRGGEAGYPLERFISEVGWDITENTGVDATCKIVALVRNEETAGWYHVRSATGGQTWETIPGVTWVNNVDYVNNVFWPMGNSAIARYPLEVKVYKGLVYIIAGARLLDEANQFLGKVEYVTATPADFFGNVYGGYSARTQVPYDCQADGKTAPTDFGYITLYEDSVEQLVGILYDASNDPAYTGTIENKREMIYQLVVVAT